MGAFASGLQGVGQAANDLGTAKFAYSDWQQQQRADRLNEIIQGVRLQQIQQQLKQMNLPQSEGIFKGVGGVEYGVNRDPNTGKRTTEALTSGYDVNAIGAAANNAIATLPEQFRPLAKNLYDSYAALGDHAGGLRAIAQIGEKDEVQALKTKTPKPPKINYEPGTGLPVSIDDGLGNTFDVNDPNLPANLKTLKASALSAHSQHLKEQEATETRRGAESLSRAAQLIQMREDEKLKQGAIKASYDALGAKQALDLAKQHAARKEAFSDLSMIYLAVRANVQGAGRMTQTEVMQQYNAGSLPDVWSRRIEKALHGTLPDKDREEVLHLIEDGYRSKRKAGEEAFQTYLPDKPLPPWLRKSPEEEDSEQVDGWIPPKKK